MSRPPFGAFQQNAFVVPSIEDAIADFSSRSAIGPFFVFPSLEFTQGSIRGQRIVPSFRAAVAYSGDLMIELIEPSGPSIFAEFLDHGGSGVHHNCVTTHDHDLAVSWFIERGAKVIQHQVTPDGSQMSYLEMATPGLPVVEVAQLSPEATGLFAWIKGTAADWDGQDPVLTMAT